MIDEHEYSMIHVGFLKKGRRGRGGGRQKQGEGREERGGGQEGLRGEGRGQERRGENIVSLRAGAILCHPGPAVMNGCRCRPPSRIAMNFSAGM